jgi:hypothetical protein
MNRIPILTLIAWVALSVQVSADELLLVCGNHDPHHTASSLEGAKSETLKHNCLDWTVHSQAHQSRFDPKVREKEAGTNKLLTQLNEFAQSHHKQE